MNLLFDFITLQTKTGAAEYVRSVFFALLNKICTNNNSDIKIFALYDSSLGVAYDDLKEEILSKKYENIKYVDVYKKNICTIITEYKINRFFIGCAQYLGNIPGIENISCETYCVVHDLVDEEVYQRNIDVFVELLRPSFQLEQKDSSLIEFLQYKKRLLSFMFFFRNNQKGKWNKQSRTGFIAKQYKNNPNFHLITDSEYSKKSIILNCKISADSIDVLYPPERMFLNNSSVSNHIKECIEGKKIYLFLNADRSLKNPYNTITAFKAFAEANHDCFLVTAGYPQKEFSNHIPLPFLSDGDLKYLTEHCYALIYPSFFEGFGYPPIESMKFGKPIFSSNTTSLPEILGNAAIYFSPLYTTGIYKALFELTDDNYNIFTKKSIERYSLIRKKTESDLEALLNYITNGKNE